MSDLQCQYLLVINRAPKSVFEAASVLKRQKRYKDLELLVLTDSPQTYSDRKSEAHIVACDFNSEVSIAKAIGPYREHIRAVVCRGDKYIQDLRRVIPFLPEDVLVSTPESLEAATNKRLMRAAFKKQYPEITPPFEQVFDASDATVERIESMMRYPVIVKPANLASSLLIQSCENRAELKKVLAKTFAYIEDVYRAEGRRDKPQVIVEEYLTGDYYSIDAYVMGPGEIFFCPPVAYVSAKQLGIDDFFLYKRFLPTKLTPIEIATANEVTAKAINALGLTHTSTHVELILTEDGWKIIELGPRIGNFRDSMYRQAFGIEHALNDLRIRLGHKPNISSTAREYCVAYRIYPSKEGTLRGIRGLDYLQRHPALYSIRFIVEPGSQARFAKNGGHALVEFVLSSKDKKQFDDVVDFVEKNIESEID
jgi:glutathione synthase/RimK-type ligase-like ATP-grasp enzyme